MRKSFANNRRANAARALLSCALLFAAPAAAQKLECGSLPGDAGIAACTRGIESGRHNGKDLANFYGNRAYLYLQKRDTERALADLGQSLKLYPDNPVALNNLGRIYLFKNDNDRALAEFDNALRADPHYAPAHANRGLAFERKGEFERAIASYDEALRLRPDLTVVRRARGRLIQKK